MSAANIANDRVVAILFKMHEVDGDLIEDGGDDPMVYLHGHANIPPGLEAALEGKAVGDNLDVKLTAAEGFGERQGTPQAVPRSEFPEGIELEAGMAVHAEDEEGNIMPLWIAGLDDEVVMVDANHPLAGVALRFEVEVQSVRDATAEELEHGHPHGLSGDEGHHHEHEHGH